MTEFNALSEAEICNTIRFYNTMDERPVEVLRMSKDGITANPDIPVDEAAGAVLRALNIAIKNMVDSAIKDERKRIADEIERMPFGDTSAAFAVWVRNGAVYE